MALSRGMNQEASQDTDLGLLDATLMQNLQDRFCDANNVYLVCLSRTRGVVTKAYGCLLYTSCYNKRGIAGSTREN